ncbi:MAG: T9SS type A sorting domain-containing protein [Bacteroidales bacterium]
MKKLFILIITILLGNIVNAQTYTIGFAATGAATIVDSVKIENLTHTATKTWHAGDLLQLQLSNSIKEMVVNDENFQVYPNPMQGQVEISFYAKQAGNARLTINDISGKEILNTENKLLQGIQKYQLNGLNQGVYFINISGDGYLYTSKLISRNTASSHAKIRYIGAEKPEANNSTLKSTNITITMPFYAGDNFRFTGYAGSLTSVVNDVPTGSKTISFVFSVPPLSIGASYQGGIIAYILQVGDPGYIAGQTHGLIAAPSDQSTSIIWGCYLTGIPGANDTAIGTGYQNTIDIVAGCTVPSIAAKLCADLVLNGYSDWYLPSKDELAKLYNNRIVIGGFSQASYWSSSEYNDNLAWVQYFEDGSQIANGKYFYDYVRAVRSF